MYVLNAQRINYDGGYKNPGRKYPGIWESGFRFRVQDFCYRVLQFTTIMPDRQYQQYLRVSQIWGYLFGGPYNNDYSIWGLY